MSGGNANRPAPLSAHHGRTAFERITVDPDRMGGVPSIRDLRVTVGMVLGQLAGGRTIEEVLEITRISNAPTCSPPSSTHRWS